MAVAVKTMPDSKTEPGSSGLFVPSLFGAAYVVAALAVIFAGVPAIWAKGADEFVRTHLGSFVSTAGLLVVELFAISLLAMIGLTLTGGKPAPGLKAGIFTIIAGVLIVLAIMSAVSLMWRGPKGEISAAAEVVAVAMGALSAFFIVRFFSKNGFNETMQTFEQQGWFTAAGYKTNQGKRVRRATLLGILTLAGAGIYALIHHQTLTSAAKDLWLWLPMIQKPLTILPDVRMTVPLVLAGAAVWLSYRLVNMPIFAEFLIATESELNKVAWPTRRSLMQDTIVVLSTVVLMTVFLFVVDVAWGKILSHPYVGVLRFDTSSAANPAQDTPELDW